jgi:hypothetical protein
MPNIFITCVWVKLCTIFLFLWRFLTFYCNNRRARQRAPSWYSRTSKRACAHACFLNEQIIRQYSNTCYRIIWDGPQFTTTLARLQKDFFSDH